MALTIKSIPTLRGEVAESFVKKAEAASKKKGNIDFSKQVKAAAEILKKANL